VRPPRPPRARAARASAQRAPSTTSSESAPAVVGRRRNSPSHRAALVRRAPRASQLASLACSRLTARCSPRHRSLASVGAAGARASWVGHAPSPRSS